MIFLPNHATPGIAMGMQAAQQGIGRQYDTGVRNENRVTQAMQNGFEMARNMAYFAAQSGRPEMQEVESARANRYNEGLGNFTQPHLRETVMDANGMPRLQPTGNYMSGFNNQMSGSPMHSNVARQMQQSQQPPQMQQQMPSRPAPKRRPPMFQPQQPPPYDGRSMRHQPADITPAMLEPYKDRT